MNPTSQNTQLLLCGFSCRRALWGALRGAGRAAGLGGGGGGVRLL